MEIVGWTFVAILVAFGILALGVGIHEIRREAAFALGSLVSLCGVALIALGIGLGVLIVEESRPLPASGVVVRKIHREAWTQVSTVMVGKVPVTSVTQHPESWSYVIQADGTDGDEGQRSITVSRETYDKTEVGDKWVRP